MLCIGSFYCIIIVSASVCCHDNFNKCIKNPMRNVGVEPTRAAPQEPKSCMSANSINSASQRIL